jgi:hypothetical protein
VKGVQRYKQDENPPNFFIRFVVKFLVGAVGDRWDGFGERLTRIENGAGAGETWLGIDRSMAGIDRVGKGIGVEQDLQNI